jgi:Glu-tRNA(Gln) amidotransferase subunit E-like FAD-binding protein
VEDAISKLGLRLFTEREIESLVDKAIEGNPGLLKEQRGEAFGAIMGIVMREVRGKAQPDTVSRIVRDKLKEKKK